MLQDIYLKMRDTCSPEASIGRLIPLSKETKDLYLEEGTIVKIQNGRVLINKRRIDELALKNEIDDNVRFLAQSMYLNIEDFIQEILVGVDYKGFVVGEDQNTVIILVTQAEGPVCTVSLSQETTIDFTLDTDDCELTTELERPTTTSENMKGETSMFSNMNGFGKADPRQFRLSINGLTVSGQDGKYYTFNPETRELIEVTTGFFDDMKDLLFIMPATTLEVGDIVLHQDKPYYITVAKENIVKGISFEDATEDTLIAKTNVFGVKYFTKVVNCLGSNNVLGDISANPMMTYALMGGNNADISKLMMFQAMSNSNKVTDFSDNPAMLMALMGKDGDANPMADMLKAQMFAQMNAKKSKDKKDQ